MANVSLCGNTAQNTGQILCDVAKGVGKKLFIFNGAYSSAQYATSALLQAALAASSKMGRAADQKIFPIPEMQEITDASEANTEGTLGLGFKAIIREGRPAYTIKLFAGSTLAKKLRAYNNQTIRFFEYDTNGRLWGTKQGTNFVGYLGKLFFTVPKLATGQNVEEGVITLTLSIMDTVEYNDSFYVDISNVGSIVGLLDVNLTEAAAHVSNVYKIRVEVPTSQIGYSANLYDQLSAQLVAGMWEASTPAGALTITSVAPDASLKAFTVTFDNAAYTALTNGTLITLKLKDPTTLDAADITNIESVPLVLVK